MVREPRVLTKAKPTCPRGSSSPRAYVQEPLVLSGGDILEKTADEMAPPNEPSLNEPRPTDVEMPSAELVPESVCDETERSAEPTEPNRVEHMEVEKEPQRVQPAIHPEMEVSPPEVTSIYRRLRSSSRL